LRNCIRLFAINDNNYISIFTVFYELFLFILASCLIYARALLEYVNFIVWVRSVNKMLLSVQFAEYKMLTFLILREKCNSESNLNF